MLPDLSTIKLLEFLCVVEEEQQNPFSKEQHKIIICEIQQKISLQICERLESSMFIAPSPN